MKITGGVLHDRVGPIHSQGPLLKLILQHCGYAAALVAVTMFFVLMGALAGVAYVLGHQPQLSQLIDDQRGLETER